MRTRAASPQERASPGPEQAAELRSAPAFALIGALVLTGLDHHIEAVLVAAMPDWLTAFATAL